MLKNFLKENKISIAKLTEPHRMIPPSSLVTREYYDLEWKEKPMSEPIIGAARSPNYKRRKIFERISSPQSKITAEFPQIPSFSTVEPYDNKGTPENKNVKKKYKTNKQNGLCLARATSKDLQRDISPKSLNYIKSPVKETPMPEANDHFQEFIKGESRRVKRMEELQTYNNCLKKDIQNSSKGVEESLIINEAPAEIFTFYSQKSQHSDCSLIYSNSKFASYNQKSINWDLQDLPPKSPLNLAQ